MTDEIEKLFQCIARPQAVGPAKVDHVTEGCDLTSQMSGSSSSLPIRWRLAAVTLALLASGKSIDVLTFAHVVCRPTEQEAKDYLEHFGKTHADWDAVDNLVRLQFAHAQSFPHDLLALIRDRMAAGHGGYPLVGTPEQVAEGIIAIHRTGFRGVALSFVDYAGEFPYFRDNVLPILQAAGVRRPSPSAEAAA